MEFRVIYVPSFKAASSGVDAIGDFAPGRVLDKFNSYFSKIEISERDRFAPRDFLYYDEEKQGLTWIWALCEGMNAGGNEIIDFEGGFYLTYAYKDGDEEANRRLYAGALQYIEDSGVLETDIRPGHYPMGHIITPAEINEAQGWAQMETFIPVKLKAKG